MAYTVVANSTTRTPTHHLSLTDSSGNVVGFILVNGAGLLDPRAIRRFPFLRTALKTSTGNNKYSDFELPYTAIAQDDWSGGRGNEKFEDDTSRFYDNYRCIPSADGIILGPQETYATGYRNVNQYMPGSLTWVGLSSTTAYYAVKFNASATYTTGNVEFWFKKIGSPSAGLTCEICSDNAGDPGSVLSTGTLSAAAITDTISQFLKFSIIRALTSATDYWLKVYQTSGTPTSANQWQVGVYTAQDANAVTKKSSDNSAWSTAANALYYRVTDADDDFRALFFEYKNALYFVTDYDDDGAMKIYLNGYRGAADDNSGDLTKLNDSTQTGWTSALAAGIAEIYDGAGTTEEQNWRAITTAASGVITVDPAWNITHLAAASDVTQYVIKNLNTFALQQTGSVAAKDVASTGEIVYIACGESKSGTTRDLRKYREYHDFTNGLWASEFELEGMVQASYLKYMKDPILGDVLWLARNNDAEEDVVVVRATVPQNMSQKLEIVTPYRSSTSGGKFMEEQPITNIASDSFVRGDGALGNTDGLADPDHTGGSGVAWVADVGTIQIVSNKAKATALSGGIAIATVDTSVADIINIAHFSLSGGNAGVVVRYADADNYVWAVHDGTNVVLVKRVGGVETTLHQTVTTYVAGAKLSIHAWGDKFRTYYNGVLRGTEQSITDAGLQSGTKCGIYTTSTDNTFDSFYNWARAVRIESLGTNACRVEVGPDFSTGLLCSDNVNVEDWRRFTKLYLNIWCNKAMAAGELRLDIDNTALCGSPILNVDFPALAAGQNYNWLGPISANLEFDLSAVTGADAISSVGINLTSNPSDDFKFTIQFVWLEPESKKITVGNKDDKITGLETYDDPELLFVMKQGSVWKVENEAPIKLPIREIETVKSSDNGKAHCVNDVYLYFSLQHGLERYFRLNLDDIGPNRDAGLPSARQGPIVNLASYPGRIYAAIDGGDSNTSSILCFSGTAWHEVYRAPRTGLRIRKLHIQSIPGQSTSRLWFSMGSDVCWIPVSINPYYDSDFRYTHEGVIESSWMYADLEDISKHFKSLKLFCEGVTGSSQFVEADYQVDGNTSWTAISGNFNTVPVEELQLSSASPPTVTGRRIRYRLRIQTISYTVTPRVKASVLEGVAFIPVKYGYSFNFMLDEGGSSMDLQGNKDTSYASVSTKMTQLQTWANTASPLTLASIDPVSDNTTVFLDPTSIATLMLDQQEASGEGRVKFIGQATVNQT